MALQVNATLENNEGLEVVNPVVYLDIHFSRQPFAYLFWYKDAQAIAQNKVPINIPNIFTFLDLNGLSNTEFFGPDLILKVHELGKIRLEEVFGPDTVTIVGL